MPTFDNGEGGLSVRTKINNAITKVDGMEEGATGDQTGAEIKALYEAEPDTNAFTDADHSKLDGIEAGADVTDTANVTAAGAVMDSELTNETAVKAINQGLATTDSPTFGTLYIEDGSSATPSLSNTGDTNTGVFFPAADTVAVATAGVERWRTDSSGRVVIGGATADGTFHVHTGSAGAVTAPTVADDVVVEGSGSAGLSILSPDASNATLSFGSPSDNDYFFIQGFYNSGSPFARFAVNGTERMRIDSSGNVMVATTTANGADAVTLNNDGEVRAAGFYFTNNIGSAMSDTGIRRATTNTLAFDTGSTERARIDSGGILMVGKTAAGLGTQGVELRPDRLNMTRSGGEPMNLNRLASDGNLIRFYQDTVEEGSISVSGTTVSYNGAHLSRWSRLPGSDPKDINDRQIILRGSVLTNLDEMILWRGVEFEVPVLLEPAVEAVSAAAEIPEERDEDGNIIQEFVAAVEAVAAKDAVWGTETKTVVYSGPKADGEKEAVTFEGFEYQGTVYTEDNEQLNKMEVSSVKGDKNVSGVFQDWDDDDDEYLNDFYCAMTGDFVIRIAKGCIVQRGDLLMSAGDGTACPQEGELADVVRSCTVAKVTSTEVTQTYDDGSYLVPCVLMAC